MSVPTADYCQVCFGRLTTEPENPYPQAIRIEYRDARLPVHQLRTRIVDNDILVCSWDCAADWFERLHREERDG